MDIAEEQFSRIGKSDWKTLQKSLGNNKEFKNIKGKAKEIWKIEIEDTMESSEGRKKVKMERRKYLKK